MLGCRPLTNTEIDSIMNNLQTLRDKTLFSFMIYTGFRISEALSLKVSDITNDRVKVQRTNMKGKTSSRDSIIHPNLKVLLTALIDDSGLNDYEYLFTAEKVHRGDKVLFNSKDLIYHKKPISRVMAWKILNKAAKKAGLSGKIGLHSTRKTFANRVYQKFDKDILKTSKALGHRNIESTVKYLSFDTEELDNAILEME